MHKIDQAWVRLLNDHKKQPRAVWNSTKHQLLWDEMDFETLIELSINEQDQEFLDTPFMALNKP